MSDMSEINDAALRLQTLYGREPWWISVGVASDGLIVYATKAARVPGMVGAIPVKVVVTRRPQPAQEQSRHD
jgi:hypothetical protein